MSTIRSLIRILVVTSLVSFAAGCSDDRASRISKSYDVAVGCIERAGIENGHPDPTLAASIKAGQDGPIRVVGPPDDDWWLFVSLDGNSARSFDAVRRQLDEPGSVVGTENMISGKRGDFAYYVPKATVKLFDRKQVKKILKCVER